MLKPVLAAAALLAATLPVSPATAGFASTRTKNRLLAELAGFIE